MRFIVAHVLTGNLCANLKCMAGLSHSLARYRTNGKRTNLALTGANFWVLIDYDRGSTADRIEVGFAVRDCNILILWPVCLTWMTFASQSFMTRKQCASDRPKGKQGTRNKRASTDDFYRFLLQILLVFPKEDALLESFVQAAEKLSYECSTCQTAESALENYVQNGHDIVVIDNRSTKHLDAVALCRYLYNLYVNRIYFIYFYLF